MLIQFLRHGATLGPDGFRGRLDPPLSEAGWQQMHQAIAQEGPWDNILTSPLQRCRAFAHWLGKDRTVPVETLADLRELDFGDWEGRTAAELMVDQADELGRFWADPYAFTPPRGEPVARFEQRVLRAMLDIVDRYQGRRVLIVTHGGVIRLLLARQLGLPRAALLQVEVPYGTLHGFDLAALPEDTRCSHC